MSIETEPDGSQTRVTFRRRAEVGERSVAVVGEFNSWSTGTNLMTAQDDGSWSVTIPMSPGRAYRFRYLVDDQRWENDPDVAEVVPNDLGGQDSLVDLRTEHPRLEAT